MTTATATNDRGLTNQSANSRVSHEKCLSKISRLEKVYPLTYICEINKKINVIVQLILQTIPICSPASEKLFIIIN